MDGIAQIAVQEIAQILKILHYKCIMRVKTKFGGQRLLHRRGNIALVRHPAYKGCHGIARSQAWNKKIKRDRSPCCSKIEEDAVQYMTHLITPSVCNALLYLLCQVGCVSINQGRRVYKSIDSNSFEKTGYV